MKSIRIVLFFLSIGLSLSCSKETVSTSNTPSDSQVIGSWTLIRIINGFGQTTQKPADIGLSETINYKPDGTYQRITIDKLGQHEDKGNYSTGPNPTKTGDKQAILYPDDKTTQPYSFQDGHLFLYQRGPQEATIADGSMYEYQRQ